MPCIDVSIKREPSDSVGLERVRRSAGRRNACRSSDHGGRHALHGRTVADDAIYAAANGHNGDANRSQAPALTSFTVTRRCRGASPRDRDRRIGVDHYEVLRPSDGSRWNRSWHHRPQHVDIRVQRNQRLLLRGTALDAVRRRSSPRGEDVSAAQPPDAVGELSRCAEHGPTSNPPSRGRADGNPIRAAKSSISRTGGDSSDETLPESTTHRD